MSNIYSELLKPTYVKALCFAAYITGMNLRGELHCQSLNFIVFANQTLIFFLIIILYTITITQHQFLHKEALLKGVDQLLDSERCRVKERFKIPRQVLCYIFINCEQSILLKFHSVILKKFWEKSKIFYQVFRFRKTKLISIAIKVLLFFFYMKLNFMC